MFDYPPIDRSTVIIAATAEQAMIKAVVERKVPVQFSRDTNQDLQPVYWQPHMGGDSRWPKLKSHNCLQWGLEPETTVLRFDIEQLEDES